MRAALLLALVCGAALSPATAAREPTVDKPIAAEAAAADGETNTRYLAGPRTMSIYTFASFASVPSSSSLLSASPLLLLRILSSSSSCSTLLELHTARTIVYRHDPLDPPTAGGAAAAAPAQDPGTPRTTPYHAATGVPRAAYDDLKLIVGVDFTHGGRAANSTRSY
jgi:hypothetical protein